MANKSLEKTAVRRHEQEAAAPQRSSGVYFSSVCREGHAKLPALRPKGEMGMASTLRRAGLGLACLISILFVPTFALAAKPAAKYETIEAYVEALKAAFGKLEKEQCAGAVKRLPAFIDDKFFASLKVEGQRAVLNALADCAWEMRDYRTAFDAFGKLGPITDTPDDTWRGRIHMALALDDGTAALSAFQTLAKVHPEGLSTLSLNIVFTLIREARKLAGGDERAFGIYQTLAAAKYVPPEPLEGIEGLQVDHARELLRRRKVEEARARVAGITDLESVIGMDIDLTFDALTGAQSKAPNYAALIAAHIAASERVVKARPKALNAVNALIHTYLSTGKLSEALALADKTLVTIAKNPKAFEDTEKAKNWTGNARAYALLALGRSDEAVAAMRGAKKLGEYGEKNVSQAINLALILVDLGRGEEAVAELKDVGDASEFGKMFLHATKACAAAQKNDVKTLKSELDYLRTHEADNIGARQRALICANDADEAAALIVRRLNDPTERTSALFLAQNWTLQSSDGTYGAVLRERLALILARAEVKAAVAKYGRVRDIPLARSQWGDI